MTSLFGIMCTVSVEWRCTVKFVHDGNLLSSLSPSSVSCVTLNQNATKQLFYLSPEAFEELNQYFLN
jgi:hypothetical protein